MRELRALGPVITQGTLTIRADRIDFKQNADNSLSATAYGKPLAFRQKRDDAEGYYEGWAQRAEYDGGKEELQLFDNAILKKGEDEIRSNYISYNAATELFKAEGRYWLAYQTAVEWFGEWGFWAVFIAGFSPIPYKVFTIAAGALSMALLPFALASLVGRGARFFLVAGLMACVGYMAINLPWSRNLLGIVLPPSETRWWDIEPTSAGVFGVPIGLAVMVVVSLLTRPDGSEQMAVVDRLRRP